MAHVEYPDALINEAAALGVQLGSGEDYDPSDALETLAEELEETARMNGDVSSLRVHGEPFEDADFGFSFKKLGRSIGRIADKATRGPLGIITGTGLARHTLQKAVTGKGVYKGALGNAMTLGATAAVTAATGGAGIVTVIGKNPLSQLGGSVARRAGSLSKAVTPHAVVNAVKKTVTSKGVVSFGIKANADVKGAMAAADRLLGDTKINNSALIVRNTKALAALGDPAAKRGLSVLNAVGTIRVSKRIPRGQSAVPRTLVLSPVVQTTSPARVKSLVETTVAKKAADAKNQTWVQKLLGWFGLQAKK